MNTKQFKEHYSKIIKQTAKDVGFDACGIAKVQVLNEEARQLENWLKKNFHGKMQYMEKYFDIRINPSLLLPGAKSIISLLFNYYPSKKQNSLSPKVSVYAYGKDYHIVLKEKLQELYERLKEKIGHFNARACVDSAPVMDKVWAKKSGLGWIGKHSNLIVKQKGSYYFIAELITDLELEPDKEIKDYCGTCTRCIDACPTNAIVQPYVIDASKCISYLTIELKDEIIPNEFKDKMNNWIFGCDICMDVCPWNKFATPHEHHELEPIKDILDFSEKDWKELSEEQFKILFKWSPIKRTKYKGIKRNINFVLNKENKHDKKNLN
ncbi:MAG: tRNA epoxyqueuosine(34) reductase QueG [Bacteroidia bacterium]|nr:tRNA epoxyqueuosine(34) reductase QueG [Bacteroidia bacterium]